ncbi:quinoprotein glucose dehydrogenase [Pseudoxanthomonas sp. GM95]|uniref:pyrroloquinoline quinone-dependent dehydrogenase n=1 Tax=Pseudoxanthomonas sp. GM95 TaxID=1881043 RepID=UPI0008CD140A|nr:pyrroloquinoline quinone-dependent dehydrogenase [Pseudoxanthomonas sp. GM95]SEM18098.1 quinoprotein glucose dehydrogenase [Pseudoxanthomonas sp. GM95]
MKRWQAGLAGVAMAFLAGSGWAGEGDWAHYGGAPGGGQYSPLTQVTPGNVGRLKVAWSFHTGEQGAGLPDPERRRFEANPLVVDGRMYLTTGTDIVFALDAATGIKLWSFDPKIARDKHYSDPASRGVTYWRDPQAAAGSACATRIVFGTLDARLIALDAGNGQPCAGFGTAGTIDLHVGIDSRDQSESPWRNYAVTSPPVIAGDVLVSGSSVGDNRAHKQEQGVVRGYDVRTGQLVWRWDPVPRNADDPRAAGWQVDQASTVGSANAWPPLSVDPALGLVYVPTGSASPDYYGGERVGDNRDANSLVALDAKTGRRVWAQQLVHHDLWDYDLASQPALATVQTAQGPREAVLQATKTGFLFAFDRRNGEPVFPISEVPVPASDVPGEHASPTQPMPEPALRLARHAPLTAADAWGVLPSSKQACAKLIGGLRSEGIFTPPSVRGTIASPGWGGGINWGGIAIDPARQLAIMPVMEVPMQVALIPRADYDALTSEEARTRFPGQEFNSMDGTPYAMRRGTLLSPSGTPCVAPPWGKLVAVNLRTRTVAWERPLGTLEDMLPWLPLEVGMPMLGGAVSTASGLTFIAAAADARLRAFDSMTGKELWSSKLPAGGHATPSVYAVNGTQYIAIAAGGREGLGKLDDALVVYTLDGTGKDLVFQHGVAVRMTVLAVAGVLVLALLSGGPVWWWKRRRCRR